MVNEQIIQKKKTGWLDMNISFGGVSLLQKALFAKHMAVMIRSGVSITDALRIAGESAQGRFKKILEEILNSVSTGHTLSSSFERYPHVFSGLFISATYSGEESGTLDVNLEKIAEELKKEKELSDKITGAMIYPIIILIATFVLGLALSFFILPKITPLFEGLKIDLPWTTRLLIWFSHFVQRNTYSLLFGITGFVIFMSWLVNRKFSQPVTHWLILNTPIIRNVSRSANLAIFSRTMGMLLKSGVNIVDALNITRRAVKNHYYQKVLLQIGDNIKQGTKLSDNLDRHPKLFPLIISKMVKVGEESGKLEDVFFYLDEFYEAEVDIATKAMSTAIEPTLLIVVGLAVGFLTLSIITPIYNITGSIQR